MVNVCAHTFFLSLPLDEMINSLHEVNYVPVWFQLKLAFSVFCFYFLVPAALFDQVNREQCIHAPFTDPQISFFSYFFIKNGSHDTIHIFKNYFITIFSVFNKISDIQTDLSQSLINLGGLKTHEQYT